MNNASDSREQIMQILAQAKSQILDVLTSATPPNGRCERSVATGWMTACQLAEYWQFVDEHGKPRTAGILKWTKRPPDGFPLPHAYMGDLLRFNRDDVDQWAKEEAERRRAKKEQNRLRTRD